MLIEYRTQLLEIVFIGLGFVALLTVVEILKRKKLLQGEGARKTIHISVGFILAALPIFMDRWQVILTNFGFFVGVLLFTGLFHVFTAVHAVRRWTIGEFLYPLSTGLVALFFEDLRIYSYAVLILALSDGLAGLVGRSFGGKGYKILGGRKTLIGNLAFFIAASITTLAFWSVSIEFGLAAVAASIMLGAMLTVIESLVGGGFDNPAVTFAAAITAWFILQI